MPITSFGYYKELDISAEAATDAVDVRGQNLIGVQVSTDANDGVGVFTVQVRADPAVAWVDTTHTVAKEVTTAVSEYYDLSPHSAHEIRLFYDFTSDGVNATADVYIVGKGVT